MKKFLIYSSLLVAALSSVACTHPGESYAKDAIADTDSGTHKSTGRTIKIVNNNLYDYLSNDNDSSNSLAWEVLDKENASVDSLRATLVSTDKKKYGYSICYPVFKEPLASLSNDAYKRWYTSQLAQDSMDTPTVGTWLRLGRGRRAVGQMEEVDYYAIKPVKSTIYTTPAGTAFISSGGTYTVAGGTNNLSGLLTHLVRVRAPARNFTQEFDESVSRRGWPELTDLVQQQRGVSFRQLSDSSSINRQFFFASKGLVIGFESDMDSNTSFIVEIPYNLFNERFNK